MGYIWQKNVQWTKSYFVAKNLIFEVYLIFPLVIFGNGRYLDVEKVTERILKWIKWMNMYYISALMMKNRSRKRKGTLDLWKVMELLDFNVIIADQFPRVIRQITKTQPQNFFLKKVVCKKWHLFFLLAIKNNIALQ